MADFAKYAFNKSHAAAYATLTYQTAYLKRYYMLELFAAVICLLQRAQHSVRAQREQYGANECRRQVFDDVCDLKHKPVQLLAENFL